MFVKMKEREEARRIRAEEGESIKSIAARLDVAVSSVSLWVRDIELTEPQVAALRDRNPRFNRQFKGQQTTSRRARERREAWQLEGRADARAGDPLHRLGCMLFWAEGSKNRCNVHFTNADADMLRLFRRFITECFAVEPERLVFTCNCYLGNGLSLTEIEDFWLHELDLPRSSLRKPAVNRASSASQRKRNTLLYGTGRLSLHSTEIVQRIYGAIQEYGGFDRPEWLD